MPYTQAHDRIAMNTRDALNATNAAALVDH
jgi:hypothetical protein